MQAESGAASSWHVQLRGAHKIAVVKKKTRTARVRVSGTA